MSELINSCDASRDFRHRLLATSSIFVLIASVSAHSTAMASDTDERPTVWIELGGQLGRLNAGQEAFSPAIMAERPAMFETSPQFERSPLFSAEKDGKFTFQPSHSDWSFSASVRYGRSTSKKHVHQQTYPQPFKLYYKPSYRPSGGLFVSYPPYAAKFADTLSRSSESHLILDFEAGKDVGLGMFGRRDGTSVVTAGVRFAQFTSKSNIQLKSGPDFHIVYSYPTWVGNYFTPAKWISQQVYHSNLASLTAQQSFHGLGPSISWNASLPVIGSHESGELAFDWGVNAALLFGRQKVQTEHKTSAYYASGHFFAHRVQLSQHSTQHTRSRGVTVPNVGGFAGVSFRFPNAKVALGYRADFFFGAMDGGIDTRKSYDRNFYGPFATISIGLGG